MYNWTENAYNKFWAKMLGIYGKRWAEDHGAKINDTWREVLKRMPMGKVAATLNVCLEAGDAHPITLSQFVKRAKAIRLNQESDKIGRAHV